VCLDEQGLVNAQADHQRFFVGLVGQMHTQVFTVDSLSFFCISTSVDGKVWIWGSQEIGSGKQVSCSYRKRLLNRSIGSTDKGGGQSDSSPYKNESGLISALLHGIERQLLQLLPATIHIEHIVLGSEV
jgi:hypothetical protein